MADPREVLTRPVRPPDRTERFGPLPHECFEVYEPPSQRFGRGIVLVHGGFWRSDYDRTHLRPLASALAAAGWPVALLEYRGTGADGGGHPATLEDVRAGLARVRSSVAAAPGATSPARGAWEAPVLVGHSAGGHLALWLLHQPEGRGLPGAVSVAGCVDLGLVARLRLDHGAAQDLLGGEPEQVPDIVAALDPVALGRAPARVLLVHGEDDDIVPPAVSRSWLEQAGLPGRDELVLVPGCEHYGLIDPLHPAHATVLEAVRRVSAADPPDQ